jgi:hypothetical protein
MICARRWRAWLVLSSTTRSIQRLSLLYSIAAAASADTERQPLRRFQPVGDSHDRNTLTLTCTASLFFHTASLFFHTSKRAARPLNPYPSPAILIRVYERRSLLESIYVRVLRAW